MQLRRFALILCAQLALFGCFMTGLGLENGLHVDWYWQGGAMARENRERELIAEAAAEFDVPLELLEELLGVAENFTGFSAYGAKTDFSRRIALILDKSAQQQAES